MIGQQVLNPLVEMMLVVVYEYQVLGRIDDEFLMNGKQLVLGKIIAKPWVHHLITDVQEVSSIVEQKEDSEIVPSLYALHWHELRVV
ncbi:hypothetical protein Tco_1386504 [Tanacetum coccineum]